MNLKSNPAQEKFPLWDYLTQRLFSSTKLILNPHKFWKRYKMQRLERCWSRDVVQELESCFQQDCNPQNDREFYTRSRQ